MRISALLFCSVVFVFINDAASFLKLLPAKEISDQHGAHSHCTDRSRQISVHLSTRKDAGDDDWQATPHNDLQVSNRASYPPGARFGRRHLAELAAAALLSAAPPPPPAAAAGYGDDFAALSARVYGPPGEVRNPGPAGWGAPSQLYYPDWMNGTWSVTATFAAKQYPYEKYVRRALLNGSARRDSRPARAAGAARPGALSSSRLHTHQ